MPLILLLATAFSARAESPIVFYVGKAPTEKVGPVEIIERSFATVRDAQDAPRAYHELTTKNYSMAYCLRHPGASTTAMTVVSPAYGQAQKEIGNWTLLGPYSIDCALRSGRGGDGPAMVAAQWRQRLALFPLDRIAITTFAAAVLMANEPGTPCKWIDLGDSISIPLCKGADYSVLDAWAIKATVPDLYHTLTQMFPASELTQVASWLHNTDGQRSTTVVSSKDGGSCVLAVQPDLDVRNPLRYKLVFDCKGTAYGTQKWTYSASTGVVHKVYSLAGVVIDEIRDGLVLNRDDDGHVQVVESGGTPLTAFSARKRLRVQGSVIAPPLRIPGELREPVLRVKRVNRREACIALPRVFLSYVLEPAGSGCTLVLNDSGNNTAWSVESLWFGGNPYRPEASGINPEVFIDETACDQVQASLETRQASVIVEYWEDRPDENGDPRFVRQDICMTEGTQ
jgi:hypothetical protein